MIKTDILKVECNSVTNEEVYSFKLEWPARLPKKYFQFIAQWRFKKRRSPIHHRSYQIQIQKTKNSLKTFFISDTFRGEIQIETLNWSAIEKQTR